MSTPPSFLEDTPWVSRGAVAGILQQRLITPDRNLRPHSAGSGPEDGLGFIWGLQDPKETSECLCLA